MGVWDNYKYRFAVTGRTKRESALIHAGNIYNDKIKGSLAYHEVLIDGQKKNVEIVSSDNLNEKWLISMPGEDIDCGVLVEYEDNMWIATEKDASNELQTRLKLMQCNYLLKWVNDKNEIIEQWSVIDDGTKLKRLAVRNSFRTRGRVCKNIYLIAGKPLELYIPQRNDEICVSVMGRKIHRLGNQQPSLEQRKVRRSSRKGVGSQVIGDSKR